jgi:hypothetical protein
MKNKGLSPLQWAQNQCFKNMFYDMQKNLIKHLEIKYS